MPGLPPDKSEWPPPQLKNVLRHMDAWDAWYTGDGERLAVHYGGIGPTIGGALDHVSAKPGLIGRMARWFWGQPSTGTYRTKLHVPIAADICQAGADLLFAEPPTFTVDDVATQDRLNELGDDTLHGVLAEAAEIGGALGGSYLRVTWDKQVVPDRPFLTSPSADAAWPEFRWGRLTAVTFWRVVLRDDKAVWRHLERHELDLNGVGHVLHGLYQGDDGNLGRSIPLTEAPSTAALAELVDENAAISTESPGLAVVYIPNQRPQRRWRKDPVGCNLGRSHLDGVEHQMDALDETYSSWMRDIRLGKARVFVAKEMLADLGPGKGTTVDLDQEIYSPVNAPPGSLNPNNASNGANGYMMAQQFAIRVTEHQATANQLLEDILRTAGFSSQTFGIAADSARASNLTATEVQARERRSYLTRDRMTRLWNPAVTAIVGKLLAVDQAVFNTPVVPQLPNMAFADSVQESIITLAQTVQALDTARAASTETKVQMLHPDWDDKQIQDEVKLIRAEEAITAPTVPDPATFTGYDPSAGTGQ